MDLFRRKEVSFGAIDNLPGKHRSFTGGIYNAEIDDLYRLAYPNISVIARRSGEIPIYVTKKSDPEYIYNSGDHWLASLISNPNKEQSPADFIESVIKSSIMFPNTFIIFGFSKVTSLKEPISMRVALYNEIRPRIVANKFEGWEIMELRGRFRLLDPREFILIKEWSPVDNINGFAPINSAYQFLTLQQTMYLYQRGVFSRPIPAGGYIIEANDADFKDITGRILQQLKDPDSANIQFIQKRPGADNVGVDFVKYSQDNKTLDMGSLFTETNQRIDDTFGVPKQMKGDVEGTNLAGVKTADSVFMDNNVKPRITKFKSLFNNWIGTHYSNEDIEIQYDIKDAVDPLEVKTEAETLKIKLEAAKIMRDMGVPTTIINTTLDLDLEFESTSPSQDTTLTNSVTTDSNKSKQRKLNKLVTKTVKLIETSKNERDKYYNELNTAFTKHLKYLEDEVLGLQAKSTKSIDDINQIDIDSDTQKLYDLLIPIFLSYMGIVAIEQFNEGAAELGGNIAATGVLTESAKAEYGIYLYGLLKGWHTDTAVALSNIKNDAITNSSTYQSTRKEIINYFRSQGEYINIAGKTVKNNAVYRADRLIRTESVRSGNYASISSMKKIQDSTGFIIKKVWARTRSTPEPICDHLNGTTVGIETSFWGKGEILDIGGKTYTNDFLSVQAPPAHANCSCIIKEFKIIGG